LTYFLPAFLFALLPPFAPYFFWARFAALSALLFSLSGLLQPHSNERLDELDYISPLHESAETVRNSGYAESDFHKFTTLIGWKRRLVRGFSDISHPKKLYLDR
jgi:hypothetical protein